MSAEATLKLEIAAQLTKALDLGSAQSALNYLKQTRFTDGTGADQIKAVWHDQRTLASGASENLDLAGVLADAFGDVITFAKIKALLVFAAAANTTEITVGGAASNAWQPWAAAAGDAVKLKPGGMFLITAPNVDGLAVTAGTADQLRVLNAAGASATYDIVLLGTV